MKLKTTLLLAGLCTGLLAGNANAQAVIAVEPDHCAAAVVDPLPPDDTGAAGDAAVTEEVAAPEVTEPAPGPDAESKDPEVVVDPAVCQNGVPIDWIKRGDGGDIENPDVIFYTLGSGGPLNGAGAPEVSGDAGKDEALPLPKAKISPVKPLERHSSKTKAVVKSGRVFLRH